MKQMQNMSTTEVLVTLFTLGIFVPIAIPTARDVVLGWLLEHGVLAVAGGGVFTIPGLEADVTGRSLTLLVLMLVVAGLIARMSLAARRAHANGDARERGVSR